MNTAKISPSEIEALSDDLSFIQENNIDAQAAVEDFRSALNFATAFPGNPTAKKAIDHIRSRIKSLKPVELELVSIAA
ncbi:hypothetical protein KAR91_83230 [Candidatus Pacearchaeota archaeon]|nr:hypothetical protein [Candidatus Pacearchaeota archaeon]